VFEGGGVVIGQKEPRRGNDVITEDEVNWLALIDHKLMEGFGLVGETKVH